MAGGLETANAAATRIPFADDGGKSVVEICWRMWPRKSKPPRIAAIGAVEGKTRFDLGAGNAKSR